MTENADADVPTPEPRKSRGRSVGFSGIAIVLALVALALAAWSTWHLQRVEQAGDAARTQDAAALAGLQNQLAASNQQSQAGSQRLAALESQLDDLRASQRGLDRRTSNLETAFSNLSGQQQSGRDTLLLNDAEMLLRVGQQRYELFQDTGGALKAYSQAIDVLAQVQNPAYASVRTSANTERNALAAAAPPSRQASLDRLSALRGKLASWPLASAEKTVTEPSKPGFWSRIAHSFGSIVKVTHDNGGGARPADTRFARQALALDLAQAQEALLAFDDATFRNALQRADATLAAQFDTDDSGVKDARAAIAAMLSQPGPGPAPQLGGALAQLQSLRASQTPAITAPAPATTSGGTRP
ncbi:MAG TPA: uroporphyrinogen-III C-methyltransferase [Rhodanobacteraceae bacterium]|nr:uroporphyrinogen-III C-methyltransferase [Rhodanobacteraceae bacterium]